MNHMLSKIEVRHDEPDEKENGTQTQEVEGHTLEEVHVDHVREAADAIIVPFLEDNKLNEWGKFLFNGINQRDFH